MSPIADRLAEVHSRLERAARECGRDPATIRLIAVSKRHEPAAMRAAYEAGQRDFGESYVQELTQKAEVLGDLPDMRLHLIGHLQRNKAKQAVRAASAVHTVDSTRLADELGKRAAPVAPSRAFPIGGATSDKLVVFVEVNVGEEPQKSGCRPEELSAVLDAIEGQPALRLAGLMTVPPYTDDPTGARPYMDRLVDLRDRHGGPGRLPEISLGMSHDLEQAVFAGTTIVRVGTAIFGPREPVR